MEYPGTKFTRPVRMMMFSAFVAAFFIIAPGVILYSAGYRYDFRSGLLKETGSLSVDVLPKDATAYLDGLKIEDTMPIRLNNITPRKYTLVVSSPGYYDWQTQIEIHKNQTTYIKGVVLLRRDRPKLITKDKASVLTVSNDGRFLAYLTVKNNRTEIVMTDSKLGTTREILEFSGNPDLSLAFAPLADYLVVSSPSAPYKTLYIVNAISNETTNLAQIANGPISKFVFRKTQDPEIYYSTATGLFSYLPSSEQNLSITSSTLDWYIDDGILWTASYSTSTQSLIIIRDTLGFNTTFATVQAADLDNTSPADWKLAAAYNRTVLLQNSNAGKFLIVRPDKNFLISASRFLVSKYGSWLILWNPSELWTYSEGDDPFLLNRSGAPLQDVLPLDLNNTLALRWNDATTALFPYYFIERDLISGKATALAADSVSRILYYSDADGIWKVSY